MRDAQLRCDLNEYVMSNAPTAFPTVGAFKWLATEVLTACAHRCAA